MSLKKRNSVEITEDTPMNVLKADCEEIIRSGMTDCDKPESVSASTDGSNNNWKRKVMLGLLTGLFAGEFVLAVTAHCLTERFAMCHTLILLLFAAGKQYAAHPRKVVVFLVISLVAAQALSFVNTIHAVRMLIHRHDSGIHHIQWLLGFGCADLLLKIVNVLLTSGRHFGLGKPSAVLFHLCVPGAVLSVVILQLAHGTENSRLVLMLDPFLTIVCCVVFSIQLTGPLKRQIPILLLAVPKGFNVADFKRDFRKQFPNSDCHELHVYRESDGSFDVSLHIRRIAHVNYNDSASLAEATADIQRTAAEVRSLFARAGALRVTVQTELVSDALPEDAECSMKCVEHHECTDMRCCDDKPPPRPPIEYS